MARDEREILVAETDVEGRVAWVWVRKPSVPVPRPILPGQPCDLDPRTAEICGADRTAVLAWLEAQGCTASPDPGDDPV